MPFFGKLRQYWFRPAVPHCGTRTAWHCIFVICYLLLVIALTGCSAIGTSKPAALQVTSASEAAVFLDGKHLGKTPFYSEQLKAGSHTLKITASEASFLTQITLRESTLTVVNRQLSDNFMAQSGEILSLEPQKTSLLVISEPGDADLTIDGQLVGKTPVLKDDIKEWEHKLQISREGYASREFAIKIVPNFQLSANITLASTTAKEVPIT